jgi:hypothetical protein
MARAIKVAGQTHAQQAINARDEAMGNSSHVAGHKKKHSHRQ